MQIRLSIKDVLWESKTLIKIKIITPKTVWGLLGHGCLSMLVKKGRYYIHLLTDNSEDYKNIWIYFPTNI